MSTSIPKSDHDSVNSDQIKRRTKLKNISYYTISRYATEFVLLMRGFILAHVLGPAVFGVWSQMKLVSVFLPFISLGANDALVREIPFYLYRGEKEHAGTIKQTILAFNLLVSLTLVSVVVLLLLAIGLPHGAAVGKQWIIFLSFYPLGQLCWYLSSCLRAEERFLSVSVIVISLSTVSTVAGVTCAYWYGLDGFLYSFGLTYFFIICCCWLAGIRFPRPSWNTPLLLDLLKIGIPMMMSGGFLLLLWNMDKLMVWAFLSTEQLGIYAIPSYLALAATIIPEATSVVLYPKLMELVSTKKSKTVISKHFMAPSYAISYLSCPLLGILIISFHLPVEWLLPQYLQSILPGQILFGAVFFMLLTRIPYVVLFSLNQQKLVSAVIFLSILVGISVTGALIFLGYDLIGVAVGAASSFIVYGLLILRLTLKILEIDIYRVSRFFLTILAPYGAMLLTVIFLSKFFNSTATSFFQDVAYTLIRCLVILLVGGLLTWVANGKFRFLQGKKGSVRDGC